MVNLISPINVYAVIQERIIYVIIISSSLYHHTIKDCNYYIVHTSVIVPKVSPPRSTSSTQEREVGKNLLVFLFKTSRA